MLYCTAEPGFWSDTLEVLNESSAATNVLCFAMHAVLELAFIVIACRENGHRLQATAQYGLPL